MENMHTDVQIVIVIIIVILLSLVNYFHVV